MNVENTKLNEEMNGREQIMKELTGKNLELTSSLQTLESTIYPINADLKLQVAGLQERLSNNDAFMKKITANCDHLRDIEAKREKAEAALA